MKPSLPTLLLALPLFGCGALFGQSITTDFSDAFVDGTNVVEVPGDWHVRIGNTDGVTSASIFAFQLPTLGAGEVFSAASFNVRPFYITQGDQFQTISTPFNLDLVGLDRISATATVLASDFSASSTFLQADFMPATTVAFSDVNNDSAGSTALTAFLNAQYAAGANAGSFVFLRLQADAALTGPDDANNRFEILARNAGAEVEWPRIDYTVTVIPEPASAAALIGLAGLGLVATRRRRA